MEKIAVFASGNGSNFEAIARACQNHRIDAEIAICVCDKPGAGVILRARKLNVRVLEISPKSFSSKQEYESVILDELERLGVSWIVLAGYMRVIGDTLLSKFPERIINIHPSLLPAFKGLDAIGQAMNYGVKVYGVTVHFVDSSLDGGKIISQAAIPYEGNDREELEAMIHAREHVLYISTLQSIFNT